MRHLNELPLLLIWYQIIFFLFCRLSSLLVLPILDHIMEFLTDAELVLFQMHSHHHSRSWQYLIVKCCMNLLLSYDIHKLEVDVVVQDIVFRVKSRLIVDFQPLLQRFVLGEIRLIWRKIKMPQLVNSESIRLYFPEIWTL